MLANVVFDLGSLSLTSTNGEGTGKKGGRGVGRGRISDWIAGVLTSCPWSSHRGQQLKRVLLPVTGTVWY